MKKLHKENLYCWSEFDQSRNIDFHSYAWVREEGVVVFDPLPLSEHDQSHLASLGPLSHILITNSDHIRHAKQLASETGALIWGPHAEKANFDLNCDSWIGEKKGLFPGLDSYVLSGSKTEGELAFVLDGDTLVTGDLIRSHCGGQLCILPDVKLENKERAIASVNRLASIKSIEAILPGDGWPVFRNGQQVLSELVAALKHE